MPQPLVESLHIDAALTNISIAILQEPGNFVASRVFPNIPVAKQSDKFFTFPRGFFNRNQMTKRAPGARAAQVGYEVSNDSYFADVYSLETPITDEAAANADAAAPPDRAATELLTHQSLILLESQFASNWMATGVWDTDITGTAGTPGTGQVYQWSDYTNSDPIGDVRTAIDTILQNNGIKPNVMTISRPVFSALIDHPDIQGRINGGATTTQPSIANLNLLAQIFEVDEVLVSQAVVNSAAEGATDSHDFIFGKDALISYRPPSPGIMTPSAGYTFRWSGFLNGMNEMGFAIDRYREDSTKADWLRAHATFDQKVTASSLGYFFDSIVA